MAKFNTPETLIVPDPVKGGYTLINPQGQIKHVKGITKAIGNYYKPSTEKPLNDYEKRSQELAMEAGSRYHQEVSDFFTKGIQPTNINAQRAVRDLQLQFPKTQGWEIQSEVPVSDYKRYASQIDVLAKNKQTGQVAIIDLKSNRYDQPRYNAQLAIYSHMYQKMNPDLRQAPQTFVYRPTHGFDITPDVPRSVQREILYPDIFSKTVNRIQEGRQATPNLTDASKFYPSFDPTARHATPRVSFDIETGPNDQILSVSALKTAVNLQTNRVELIDYKERFYQYKTGTASGAEYEQLAQIHGLTPGQISANRKAQGATYNLRYNDQEEAYWKDFLTGSTLVGHNIEQFDMKQMFGRTDAEHYADMFNEDVFKGQNMIDTLMLAENDRGRKTGRNTLDQLFFETFGKTMEEMGLPHHLSGADVIATQMILDAWTKNNNKLGQAARLALYTPGARTDWKDSYTGTTFRVGGIKMSADELTHDQAVMLGTGKLNIEDIEGMHTEDLASNPAGDGQVDLDIGDIKNEFKNATAALNMAESLSKMSSSAEKIESYIDAMSESKRNDVLSRFRSMSFSNIAESIKDIYGRDTDSTAVSAMISRAQSISSRYYADKFGTMTAPLPEDLRMGLRARYADKLANERFSKEDMDDVLSFISSFKQAQKENKKAQGRDFDAYAAELRGQDKSAAYLREGGLKNSKGYLDAQFQDYKAQVLKQYPHDNAAEAAESYEDLNDALRATTRRTEDFKKALHGIFRGGRTTTYDANNLFNAVHQEWGGIKGALNGIPGLGWLARPGMQLGDAASNVLKRYQSTYNMLHNIGLAGAKGVGNVVNAGANILAGAAVGATGGAMFGGIGAGPGALIGAGAVAIKEAVKFGTHIWGNSKENRIKQFGETVQEKLNITGGIVNYILEPYRLLGRVLHGLVGLFKRLAVAIGNLMTSGIGKMGELGNPLTYLTGVNYGNFQQMQRGDTLLGLAGGTLNKMTENFAYQQRGLFTNGKFDEQRLVAAARLGVFSSVYANGGDPKAQFASVANKLAGDLRTADPRRQQEIMYQASLIDSSLPQILQKMNDLGVKDYGDIVSGKAYKNLGISYFGLTEAKRDSFGNITQSGEREKFARTYTAFEGVISSIGNSIMRLADRLWTAFGKNLFEGANKAIYAASQGNYREAWGIIKQTFSRLWKDIAAEFGLSTESFGQALKDAWNKLWNGSGLGDWLTGAWKAWRPKLLNLAESVMRTINKAWTALLQALLDGFSRVIAYFSTARINMDSVKDLVMGKEMSGPLVTFGADEAQHSNKERGTTAYTERVHINSWVAQNGIIDGKSLSKGHRGDAATYIGMSLAQGKTLTLPLGLEGIPDIQITSSAQLESLFGSNKNGILRQVLEGKNPITRLYGLEALTPILRGSGVELPSDWTKRIEEGYKIYGPVPVAKGVVGQLGALSDAALERVFEELRKDDVLTEIADSAKAIVSNISKSTTDNNNLLGIDIRIDGKTYKATLQQDASGKQYLEAERGTAQINKGNVSATVVFSTSGSEVQ